MRTIEEKNRMIAEFMGAEEEQTEQGEFVFAIKFQNHEKLSDFQTEFYYGTELKYHTSWDWLMPVVEEIDHLEYESERLEKIDNAIKTRQIGAVHEAVVEFIEWYNENK